MQFRSLFGLAVIRLALMSCGHDQPPPPATAAANETPATFKVISATYGIDTQIVDVTETVQSQLDNRDEVQAWPSTLHVTDPAVGTRKNLTIELLINGEHARILLPDGGRITFPQ